MNNHAHVRSDFHSGVLKISTRLEPALDADRLTVVLNGYCDRVTCQPPQFVHWPEAGLLLGHILRISDPTLLLSDWQKGCCFLGTEADDPIRPIIARSEAVAQHLGIARDQILYFGNSGAGFGALQCAIQSDVSMAVATNPLLELFRFASYNFGNGSADIFRPGATLAELCLAYPERFSIIASVRRATKAGKRPRLGLIQNVSDLSHYDSHYGEFCRAFKIPTNSGSNASNNFHATEYSAPGGHASIPPLELIEDMIVRVREVAR